MQAGDVVGFLGLNSPLMLALLFSCARLNAILTPLNWRLAAPEHARILADSAPRVVIVEPEFHAHAEPLREAFPHIQWIAAGREAASWRTWHAIDAIGDSSADIRPDADSPLLLCYTSGSTGVPKGVVLTQSALSCNAVNSTHMHDLTSKDRVLTTLPLFHVGGLNILTTPALHAGATVTLHAKFEPGETLDAIEREGITLAVLVPAQLTAMMEHPRWHMADLSSLRVVTTGSTIVPASFVRLVHGRGLKLIQVYGSTETCPIAAYQRVESAERKAGAAGLPALHSEVSIRDVSNADMPVDVDGEIFVRGPNVMRGYWNMPEATQRVLCDGWYATGDVGHLDAEGYLHVVGRKTDMIISGGENIYPAEVENILLECPDITDACVVGRTDPRWGEAVVAVVVRRAESRLTEKQVLSLLEGRVARYKFPRHVRFVSDLPRTALGKVKKEEVRAAVSVLDAG
jgi:fatty-acyl-CoA synthase